MSRAQSTGGGSGGDVTGIATSNYKINQNPVEAENGSRTLFTCPDAYVAGTLQVFMDGAHINVTETSPAAGTFTTPVAPDSGEELKCNYIKA